MEINKSKIKIMAGDRRNQINSDDMSILSAVSTTQTRGNLLSTPQEGTFVWSVFLYGSDIRRQREEKCGAFEKSLGDRVKNNGVLSRIGDESPLL